MKLAVLATENWPKPTRRHRLLNDIKLGWDRGFGRTSPEMIDCREVCVRKRLGEALIVVTVLSDSERAQRK